MLQGIKELENSMKEKQKNITSFLIRFGVSGLLLWYVFSKIDVKSTVSVIKSADPSYLIYAFLIFAITQAMLLWRWVIYIYALELKATLLNITRHYFIGLLGNLVLPTSVGGDILKTIGLCKSSDQKPRVVASVLLDRLGGFAGIALLAVLTYVLGYRLINENFLILPITVMGLGSVAMIILLFSRKAYAFACRLFSKFPKLQQGLMTMHNDIQLLKDKKIEGLKGIGVSFLGQIIYALVLFLIAKALGQEVSMVYFLVFSPIICVVSIVPSIGGLGIREVGAVYLFGKIGMDSGVAASITLIIFLFMVLAGLTGGLFYGATLPRRRV